MLNISKKIIFYASIILFLWSPVFGSSSTGFPDLGKIIKEMTSSKDYFGKFVKDLFDYFNKTPQVVCVETKTHACPPSAEELERRKEALEKMLRDRQNNKPEEKPMNPPQMPQGGGQGDGQGGGGKNDGQGDGQGQGQGQGAGPGGGGGQGPGQGPGQGKGKGGTTDGLRPEEGGEVVDKKERLTYRCKKRDANKQHECKRIPSTSVVEVKSSAGPKIQIVDIDQNLASAAIGKVHTHKNFTTSEHAKYYLTTQLIDCSNGPGGDCVKPKEPVPVRKDAKKPQGQIKFMPPHTTGGT